MFCRNCGTELSDEAAFCPKCGASKNPAQNQGPTPTVTQAPVYQGPVSPKSRLAALLLCFFVGVLGVHRFYVGKVGTGIIWIVTLGGGFGIGTLVDFIMIICGSFTDKEGLPLKIWSD